MEFEKNAPTTANDIALADAPRVTLQPVHREISIDTISSFETRQSETIFSFETEMTDSTGAATDATGARHYHWSALIITMFVVALFVAVLALLLLVR